MGCVVYRLRSRSSLHPAVTIAILLILGTVRLAGCGRSPATGGSAARSAIEKRHKAESAEPTAFQIISGSENEALEPILHEAARSEGFDVQVTYRGSVEIMLELDQGKGTRFDAVWPANSLWIELGDRHKVVKFPESVMHSPVVFGVKRSIANRLGWLDREVTIADILKAAEAGQFRFSMTSATQSNSGACAYLGFLHALAGAPDVLTAAHLADPAVQDSVRRLLQRIDRSSGSSGWLKQTFVERYAEVEAMVNYESMIIEANQELTAAGQEPLIAIYPADGLTIADSPLGYVDHGDPARQAQFEKLVAALKRDETQQRIVHMGRRAGLVGLDASKVDTSVFNPEWGIAVDRVVSPIPLPGEEVLRQALSLYQSGGLRKPSATVYVLDCSGSMKGPGIAQLKAAMDLLLDPDQSRRYLLDPSPRDIHIVVPFDNQPRDAWIVTGNDPVQLADLRRRIQRLEAGGGTNMYVAIQHGLQALRQNVSRPEDYFPAVIVMTDGKSSGSPRILSGEPARTTPIFSITFGEADDRQLRGLSKQFHGRVFDGQKDLAKAFRDARGYN